MGKRRITKAMREFIKQLSGITDEFELDESRRHPRITFCGNRGQSVVTLSKTPSDRHAVKNALAQCRRAAEKAGVI